ncbi:MAG: choice-of-anchor L domain-containing protein [Bacteroidota bacterium]|nr:choice-of-anchor L domain-containing protein [Bacteroidota bacterium]
MNNLPSHSRAAVRGIAATVAAPVRRRFFLMLIVLALTAPRIQAQLVIQEGIPLEKLVREHFIGAGAQIGNLTYRGFPRSISYFNGKNSNIGIDEGILLTSGWVGYAVGPNSVDDITFAAGEPGDVDLAGLVGAFTFDACVLEFDFVPYQDSVTFEYVFGSDEYTEYVGSKFNDVFAFFISGPGIAGKQNIALIPGTTTPVSINNVNHNLNPAYYVNNYLGATVEYDGFTKVLKAKAAVTPCETYRLKLAISDVMDPFFDSGVFLKAGSFDAGDALSVIGIRDAYENGCQPGLIEILRGGTLDKPLTVTYHVRGSATNGTDYTTVGTTVVFQPGQDTYVIPIDAIGDGIPDNGEWVTIYIEDLCQTGLVRDSIRILETAPLALQLSGDTVLCEGGSIELGATVTGGSGELRMRWDDDAGSVQPRIIVSPTTDRVYHFTVVDSLTGCTMTDSVRVRVEALPEVDAGPDRFVCPGETTSIGTPINGPAGPYVVTWSPTIGLSDPASDVTLASPPATTTYVLHVRSVTGCEVFDTVTVTVSDFTFDAGPDTLICHGDDVLIGREAEKGRPPYTYEWTPAMGLSNPRVAMPRASPDATTTYRVIARSDDGCLVEDSITVTVNRIIFDAGPDRSICRASTVVIGDTAVSPSPPVRYTWSPAIGLDDPWSPTPTAQPANSTVYTVTVTDSRGCAMHDTVRVIVNDVDAEAGGNVAICPGGTVQLQGSVRRGQNPFTYSWSPAEGLSDPSIRDPHASPATSTWYVLTVIDGNGCVDRDSMLVTVWPETEVNIRIEGSAVLCRGDSAVLDAGAGYQSYQWSTGETTQRITVRAAGRYRVAALSMDGCPARPDTIDIDVIDRPAPVITGPLTVCAGDSVRYTVAEVPGSVYLWQVFGGYILDGNDTHSIGVRWESPGSYRVTLEQIFGSAACRGDTAILVTVLPAPAPVITVSGPVSFCAGDSVRLDAPPGFASYEWSTGETGASIIVRRGGRYHVTVRNTIGCAGTSPPIDVTVFPLPEPEIVALTSMPVCEGETVRLGVTEAYASYEWSSGQRTAEITVDAPGIFTVRVRSAEGCEAESDTFAVTFLPLPRPVIIADGPLEFCEGDSVRLTTTEVYQTYAWTNGDSTRAVTIRASGSYSVRVRNAEGCDAASQVLNVLVHPLPPPPVITRPGILLECTPASAWQWYTEDSGALLPIAGATARTFAGDAGVWYRVRIRDEHGCEAMSEPFRFDEVLEAASTVALPTIATAPGEDVRITLRLPEQRNLLLAGVTRFDARIRFNASMLVPVGATPVGEILAGERVITLAGAFVTDTDILAELRFLAVLGDAAETPLVIEQFAWDQPNVAITRIDGVLRMAVCEEGGERLFDAAGRIALEPGHPNPFNTMTTLTYEVIERGYTELFILDMLGRRVARLVGDEIEPGRYRVSFDAGALASGMYIAVLRTPTVLRTQPLRLIK